MAFRRLTSIEALVAAAAPVVVLVALLAFAGHIHPVAAVAVVAVLAFGLRWFHQRPPQADTEPAAAMAPSPAADPPAPELDLNQLLEQFPDPVLLINGAREIVAANRPARDGLGVGTLGRDLALTVRHPDVLTAVETVVAGVPSLAEEITLPLPTPRTFMLHAGALAQGGDARSPRVVLVLRDETRAKRAEQSRADFVANASHELRSPLASLIGFIETLRGPAKDDAAARERFLAIMQTEAKRMSRLVDDLMSLSRVEINEHVPPRAAVSLDGLLADVVDALALRAEQKEMRIELDMAADLPAVTGDPDQLAQVFHNLVDNAVKYGRRESVIHVQAAAAASDAGGAAPGVAVEIIDQGPGIAAQHLPRLTERFYRADEGRSRRLGGTGLGLAIVKHIVNRHRGRLTIDSVEGTGTTVTVLLPAVPKALTERTLVQRHNRDGKAAHRHKTVTKTS
jgi:two-component system phosphate regulon sensor histidine kinase PhoR